MLTLGDPSGDPRPKRALELLSSMGFRVDVASHGKQGALGPCRHVEIIPPVALGLPTRIGRKLTIAFLQPLFVFPLPARILEKVLTLHYCLWPARTLLAGGAYDLILVEDWCFLPLAVRLRGKAKVLCDAREFYPRQNEEQILFRIMEFPVRHRVLLQYLPLCDRVYTVSPGLADGYDRVYGVRPEVIRSTPEFFALAVRPTDPHRIRLVHHGAANPNRSLEAMIDLMRFLDERFTLDFYLTGNAEYVRVLKRYARDLRRVEFRCPVNLDALVPTLAGYDIGIFFSEPTTFNLKHCLPNKLFEFVQARLAIAVGPAPDMAQLVRAYDLGIVADSFDVRALAASLNGLTTATIDSFKRNSDEAARALSWDREGQKLRGAIREVLAVGG